MFTVVRKLYGNYYEANHFKLLGVNAFTIWQRIIEIHNYNKKNLEPLLPWLPWLPSIYLYYYLYYHDYHLVFIV